MHTLLAALEAHASHTPHKPFLLCGQQQRWRQFSYRDSLFETERWASCWAALRLPAGAVVCIAIPHAPDLYFLFLGAMRAGLVPAFLAFPTPKQRPDIYWHGLHGLLHRTTPGCIIVAPAQAEAVRGVAPPGCIVLDTAGLAAHTAALPPRDDLHGDDSLALLQHSSGTTGSKKGVALTFGQIRHQVEAYASALAITPEDKIVSWLPLYHDMGLITGFLLPLTAGLTVVSLDAFEWVAKPALLFEAIELVEATLAWLPNFAFAHLVRVHDPGRHFALQSMRAFVSCSEPCKPATMGAFTATFASSGVHPGMLLTCYAMAESVFAATQSPPGEPPRRLTLARAPLQQTGRAIPATPGPEAATIDALSCGAPIDGIAVAIRHPGGHRHREPGIVGEIMLSGATLFAGYYRNAEATAQAFDGAWYRTGDLGFFHGGQLYVTGRLKDVIIVHGRNFYAHDIEEAVAGTPGIKPGRVAAFGRFNETAASEEVVVIAETTCDDPAARDDLRRTIRQHVFDCMELTLRHIELHDPGSLIKTTSGKVSRDENARRFAPAAPVLAEMPTHG